LIVSFGSGTGVADFFGIVTALVLSEFGMARSPYLLLFVLLCLPYYCCFLWIEGYRVKHKQYFNKIHMRVQDGMIHSDG